MQLRHLTVENLCPSATVHGCPRPRRCAGGRIRNVINYDASQNLMITVAVQLTSMSRRCYGLSFDGV